MTLANQNNVYPGMIGLSSETEFFAVEGEVKVIQNGKIKNFTELSFTTIQILNEAIDSDKKVKMALLDWHPNSQYKRLEQFTKCRFGGLDFKPDLKNNKLQEGEYWNCPLRDKCHNNGVICKPPMFNNHKLLAIEVRLMKMLSTSLTNNVIAEKLKLPLGTFHKIKQALYAKLGNVQTRQEVTLITKSLNII